MLEANWLVWNAHEATRETSSAGLRFEGSIPSCLRSFRSSDRIPASQLQVIVGLR